MATCFPVESHCRKMENKTIIQHVAAILVGSFFVMSGVGKILNVEQLIATVQNYGVPSFLTPAAIFLPPLEIVLGLLVIFPATRKASIGIIIILLMIFTGAYIYAHFFKGVQECGCSGEFSFLDKNLPQLLAVNTVLFVLSLVVFRGSESHGGSILRWQRILVFMVAILSSTASGASSIEPLVQTNNKLVGKNVYSTSLSKIISTNKDSTYALFFFSLNCPHCWEAVENIKSLQDKEVVDKVVGYTFGTDSSLVKFEDYFHLNFSTNLITIEKFKTITRSVPTIFLVKNDTIVYSKEGQIMSPLWYEQYVLRKDIIAPF